MKKIRMKERLSSKQIRLRRRRHRRQFHSKHVERHFRREQIKARLAEKKRQAEEKLIEESRQMDLARSGRGIFADFGTRHLVFCRHPETSAEVIHPFCEMLDSMGEPDYHFPIKPFISEPPPIPKSEEAYEEVLAVWMSQRDIVTSDMIFFINDNPQDLDEAIKKRIDRRMLEESQGVRDEAVAMTEGTNRPVTENAIVGSEEAREKLRKLLKKLTHYSH